MNTLPNAPLPISSRNSNGGISRLFFFSRAVRACCCSFAILVVRSFTIVIEAAAGAAGANRLGSMLGETGNCCSDGVTPETIRERGDLCSRNPSWVAPTPICQSVGHDPLKGFESPLHMLQTTYPADQACSASCPDCRSLAALRIESPEVVSSLVVRLH